MSTVDVRIVEMRFDNKDFESNIRTSMSTLDKFKEKLNLNGASSGLSNVEKAAKSLDLSGVSEGVNTISDRFTNLGIVGMEVLKRLTNAAIDFGKNAISKVTDPIISGGIKRAQNIEQAHFMLQGLVGDEAQVKEIMDQASESVNETAYSYDSAAKAAAQFTASGVKAGPALEGALRGITGVAAMTGAEYEEISRIFTTTAGNGRLMGDQLLQLGTRGLNAAADMARFFNGVNSGTIEASEAVDKYVFALTEGYEVTEADIRDWVTKGEITFEAFSEAMSSLYGAHAKKANETVNGVSANIRAALARIGADFVSPLIVQNGPLVQTLEKVRLKINEIRKATGILASQFVTPVAEKLITYFGNFVESLEITPIYNFSNALSNLWKMINVPANKEGLLKVLANLRDALENVWHNVTTVFGAIKDAFIEVFPFFYSAEDGILSFSEGLKNLTENFKLSENNANDLKNVIKGILTIIKSVVSVISKIIGLIAKSLTPILGFVGDAILAVVGFVGDLISKFGQFIENSGILEAVFGTISTVVGAVATAFQAFIEKIKEAVSAIKNSDAFQRFADHLNRAWTAIKNFSSGVLDKVVDGLKSFSDFIKSGVKNLSELIDKYNLFEIVAGGAQIAIGWLVIKFQSLEEGIRNVVKEIKNTEGFSKLAGALGDIWEKIKNFASTTFGSAVSNIRDFFSSINYSFDGSTISNFVDLVDQAAGKVADFIETIQNGKNPIREFIDNFKGFKFDFSFEGIKALFSKAAKRIKSYINVEEIANTITNVFNSIKDKIGEIDPEEALGKFGEFLTKLAKGIGKLIDNIDFVSAFSSIKTAIKDAFSTIFGNLTVEDVIGEITNFFDRIGKALSGVDWASILNGAKNLAEFILLFDLIRSTAKMFKSASGALDSFGGFLDSLSDKIGGKKHDTIGTTVLKISGSIAIIAASMYLISKIDEGRLNKSIAVIGGIFGAITLLLLFSKKIAGKESDFEKLGKAFTGIGVGLLAISGAALILGRMDDGALKKSALVIGSLITVFLLASRKSGDLTKAGGAFLGMAVAIDLLIPAMLAFSIMNWETILKGGLVIVVLAKALSVAAREAKGGGGGSILALALAIDLLIPALIVLSLMPFDTLLTSAMKLALVMTFLSLSVRLAQSNGKSASALLAMAVVIAAATIALVVLSTIEWKKLIGAATSLGIVLLALGYAVNLSNGIKLGQVLLMGVVLGEVVAALALLQYFTNADTLAEAALSLSGVLLAVAVSLRILSKAEFGKISDLVKTAVMMGVLLTECVIALVALDKFTNGEGLIEKAASLSLVLLAVSAAALILSHVPNEFPMAGALKGAATVGIIILAMGAIFELVGELADWLDTKGHNIEEKIDRGINIISSIVGGFGELVGDFIGGIGEGIAKHLPEIGAGISGFMTELQPFFDTMSSIDGKGLEENVASIAKALIYLSGAEFVDTVLNGVFGTSGLEAFGKNLAAFGDSFTTFAISIKGVPDGTMEKAQMIASVIEQFASIDIENQGGLIKKIAGDNTIDMFAQNLAKFAPYFFNFSMSIRNIPDDTAEKADAIVQIVKKFAAIDIENQGGKLAKWVGDNTLALFGQSLAAFGPYFSNYAMSVRSIPDNVTDKSDIIAKIVERFSAIKLENSGGALGAIVGDNTLKRFGESLQAFAPSFKTYASAISDLPDNLATKSNNVALIVERFAAINIPNQSFNIFKGDKSIKGLGEGLAAFAPDFVTYANAINGIPDDVVTKSNNIILIVERFASMQIANSGGSYGLLADFGKQIKQFGTEFKGFYDQISSVTADKITGICDSVYALIDVCKAMFATNASTITGFGSAIKAFGTDFKAWYTDVSGILYATVLGVCNSVRQILTLFNEISATDLSAGSNFSTALKNVAKEGVTGFCNAFTNSYGQVSLAISSLMYQASSKIQSYYYTLYSAGLSAGQGASAGLSAGISSAAASAYSQMATVAARVAATARSVLRINSPSKVMAEIGEGVDEGLALGIDRRTDLVEDATENSANTATNSMREALSKTVDLLNGDGDLAPTITPVLDLSEIQNGANRIDGMLANRSVALTGTNSGMFNSNRTIAQSVNLENSNKNVVEEITRLREDVGNLSDYIGKLRLVLDSGALVGGLINPLDTELGRRQILAGRGV